MLRCLCLFGIGLLLSMGGPRRAAAQQRRPSLHWTRSQAAASCIDPRTLGNRVEQLTGPVLVGPSDSDYAIEGHIDTRPGGFLLRLSVTGPDGVPRGERVVDHAGDDCRGFDQTLVFLIALTIDPDLGLERAVPASGLADKVPAEELLSELEAHPAVPVQLEPPAQKPVVAPPAVARTGEAPRWSAGAAAALGAGELPQPGLGLLVQLTWRWTRWLSLAGQARSSSLLSAAELRPEYRLRASLFAGSLLACTSTPNRRVVLTGCLGPEVRRLRARGLDLSTESVANLTMWGAQAHLQVAVRLRDVWSVSLQTFVHASPKSKQLFYTSLFGRETVHVVGHTAFGFSIGLIRHFGSGSAAARGTDPRTKWEGT